MKNKDELTIPIINRIEAEAKWLQAFIHHLLQWPIHWFQYTAPIFYKWEFLFLEMPPIFFVVPKQCEHLVLLPEDYCQTKQ